MLLHKQNHKILIFHFETATSFESISFEVKNNIIPGKRRLYLVFYRKTTTKQ